MADEITLDDEEYAAMQKCGYTEEEALAFKGVYNHYDGHFGKGDGRCSVALVKSMVRALGIQMGKEDEDQLSTLLNEVDENKDGSTQFPEFLLLISRMQGVNFCGMNDAAADRVAAEKAAAVKKKVHEERRVSEKAAHRASLLYLSGQQEIFDALNAHALANPPAKEDESENEQPGIKAYDPSTDGAYRLFYWKHHKGYLDGLKKEWELKNRKVTGRASSRS